LVECDESVRTKAESGESETTYGKAIAWEVLPWGVCLKRWLAPLHRRRWRRLFRDGRAGRAQLAYDQKTDRETYRAE